MKKFFLILPFIFFIFTSTFAVSYNSDPKIFIGELVGDIIKILNDKDTDKKTKAEQKATVSNTELYKEREAHAERMKIINSLKSFVITNKIC